ncbi:MAG: hypothetical protein K8R90_02735 [Candidatus Cloacimonetes bacterium]|nr:hypothetical protein [Candidatus Cloacimonadota bacterium]
MSDIQQDNASFDRSTDLEWKSCCHKLKTQVSLYVKYELGLKQRFRDYDEALRYVEEAIRIYNEERIIITQNYRTPIEILKAA